MCGETSPNAKHQTHEPRCSSLPHWHLQPQPKETGRSGVFMGPPQSMCAKQDSLWITDIATCYIISWPTHATHVNDFIGWKLRNRNMIHHMLSYFINYIIITVFYNSNLKCPGVQLNTISHDSFPCFPSKDSCSDALHRSLSHWSWTTRFRYPCVGSGRILEGPK